MTVEEAKAIWEPLLRGDGYLDAQARVEQVRPLTDLEREAADVLFDGFIEAMKDMAEAFQQRHKG